MLFVEQRKVASDHAGLFQGAHASQARGRRNTDLARQLDVADAAVGLQLLENAPVGGVEAGSHGLGAPDQVGKCLPKSAADATSFLIGATSFLRYGNSRRCPAGVTP